MGNVPVPTVYGLRYPRGVDRGWADLVAHATAADHAVQIYRNDAELMATVVAYVTAGFERREPAVVIATSEHRELLNAELADHGWDASDLLTYADAETTLASVLEDGRPSAKRFEHVVGGLVDWVSGRRSAGMLRAYGEMVDLLCRRGHPQAALVLEQLWDDLVRKRRFSLLCTYKLDLFDRETQVSQLPSICQAHSHVLPAWDLERLTNAVDYALDDVLGKEEARKIYLLIGNDARRHRIPVPQLALMWVSLRMPALAGRVLAAARERYEAGAIPV
jgi:MEDS: MEthanogen/methylotroph, DcmR Sensory domain